jgi:arsenate reductase
LLAEYLGTALLITAVVGGGITASRLSPADAGLRLLEQSLTVMLALGVLIAMFISVSGAHFNPVITLAEWWLNRRRGGGMKPRIAAGYIAAQLTGGISGTMLANVMFGQPAVGISRTSRADPHLWIGEIVATGGLVLVVYGIARSGRAPLMPAAVGAYIGAAIWFTSSGCFANPAIAVARIVTDTITGIAPASVPGFVAAELVGLVIGLGLANVLYPRNIDPQWIDS